MAISLTKGGNVNLSKEAGPAGLNKLTIGLGWNVRRTSGDAYDLDAFAVLVDANGRVLDGSEKNLIFFNNKQDASGAITHGGDNRTGEGEGDDETIDVELGRVPTSAQKIVVFVTIHDGQKKGQNFGQVENAYVRAVNAEGGTELARFDLSEDASTVTTMIFGELYRAGTEWKFRAVGDGFQAGIEALLQSYGLAVG